MGRTYQGPDKMRHHKSDEPDPARGGNSQGDSGGNRDQEKDARSGRFDPHSLSGAITTGQGIQNRPAEDHQDGEQQCSNRDHGDRLPADPRQGTKSPEHHGTGRLRRIRGEDDEIRESLKTKSNPQPSQDQLQRRLGTARDSQHEQGRQQRTPESQQPDKSRGGSSQDNDSEGSAR